MEEKEIKVFFEVIDVSGAFGLPDKLVAEFKTEDEAEQWMVNTLTKNTARGKYSVRKVFRT